MKYLNNENKNSILLGPKKILSLFLNLFKLWLII